MMIIMEKYMYVWSEQYIYYYYIFNCFAHDQAHEDICLRMIKYTHYCVM